MPNLTLEAANAILADNFAPWVLATGIKTEAAAPDAATLRVPFSDQLCRVGGILCGHARFVGCSEILRTLGLTHIAPLPAPGVGAVTTSTLPAIQPLCAL